MLGGYHHTLAVSTQIILFLKILKFSNFTSLKEYMRFFFGIFEIILFFYTEPSKLIIYLFGIYVNLIVGGSIFKDPLKTGFQIPSPCQPFNFKDPESVVLEF